ncbi:AaceriAAR024Wp [[Ashbya] aceris (nom. inval.)]|nr:AaceriAAR024Wp [[Ashbya] aceris (nom. inval.)]
MSGLGESRTELLGWLNDLLRLDYTKVEQCGTGAAYCQIMDSIYGDLPMHRVKFDARAEYESLTNFKILQSCFTKHKIEKTVFVDRLIKCRFQDNLEFLQWLRRFWIQNKDESPYDPESRRKSVRPVSMRAPAQAPPSHPPKRRSLATFAATGAPAAPRPLQKARGGAGGAAATRVPSGGAPTRGGATAGASEQVAALQGELSAAEHKIDKLTQEMVQYQDAMSLMERERDFYFGKLRDIEILVQSTQDLFKEGVYNDDPQELNRLLGKVSQILYSTEEGFEVANGADGNEEYDVEAGTRMENCVEGQALHNLITDDETF